MFLKKGSQSLGSPKGMMGKSLEPLICIDTGMPPLISDTSLNVNFDTIDLLFVFILLVFNR